MDIGVGLDATLNLSFAEQADLSQEAARLGYTSLWTPENTGHDAFQLCAQRWAASCHVIPEGLSTGIGVSPVMYRTPVAFAMSGGTLSQLTGGRFIMGTGGLNQPQDNLYERVRTMKIGVSTIISSRSIDITRIAQKAESLGFESLWLPEHPIIPVQVASRYPGSADGAIPAFMHDLVDPFIGLAQAAAVTTTIKLGTGICLVPERHPLLLAKEIATLDHLSHGRFLFGIGAGWLQEETEIMGGNFAHRWSQTREAILAMKELWSKDAAEYHGTFYDFPPVRSFPKPSQQPHPPVLLGGTARNVFKRVVAWGDGWLPIGATPEEVRKGRATLDALATAAGRAPRTIDVTVSGVPCDREAIQQLAASGASRVTIRLPSTVSEEALTELEKMAAQVLS